MASSPTENPESQTPPPESPKPDSETDSLRALADETEETMSLAREFYRCVVKDPRTKSGDHFKAVRPGRIPTFPEIEIDPKEMPKTT